MIAGSRVLARDMPAHVASDGDVRVLAEIRRPEINLALWERRLPDALSDALAVLDFGGVEFLRFASSADGVAGALRLAFAEAGIGHAEAGAVLAADVEALATVFAGIMEVEAVEIRLERVVGDACRRFHADYLKARLITTYAGPGTQWLDEAAARRVEEGAAVRRAGIRQLRPGEAGIFKGRTWPGATPIVHRSPPIADSGTARLLLVVDPAKPSAPALF